MIEDQRERMSRLVRKLDDESAAEAEPIRSPQQDAEYLRLAFAGLEPLTAQRQSRWQFMKQRLFSARTWEVQLRWFGPVAVVAVLAIIVVSAGLHLGSEPVPAYELAIAGDAKVMDSAVMSQGPVDLDSFLTITLRPKRKVRGDIALRTFRIEGGTVRRWDVTLQRADSGTFRLRETPRRLSMGVGSWDLLFAIGPPEDLPSAEQVASTLASPPFPAKQKWQSLRQRVEVVDHHK